MAKKGGGGGGKGKKASSKGGKKVSAKGKKPAAGKGKQQQRASEPQQQQNKPRNNSNSKQGKKLSGGNGKSKLGGLSNLQEEMRKRLDGGKFRMLNEQLYTTTGDKAFSTFQSEPELFDVVRCVSYCSHDPRHSWLGCVLTRTFLCVLLLC